LTWRRSLTLRSLIWRRTLTLRSLIRRRTLTLRSLIRRRTLTLRSLALRALVGRSLALRALILRALTLRALTLRLSGGTLLRLAVPLLHLRAACAHLCLILTLLVAAKYAHDLASQVAARVAIDRTSLRMSLRILIDHRLYALLLIAGKVEISEPFHPTMRNVRGASSRVLLGIRALWLTLLGVGAERRHCECDHERARCQKGGLHRHDLTLCGLDAPEGPIRTGQAARSQPLQPLRRREI
jgi:hypothetical protein